MGSAQSTPDLHREGDKVCGLTPWVSVTKGSG